MGSVNSMSHHLVERIYWYGASLGANLSVFVRWMGIVLLFFIFGEIMFYFSKFNVKTHETKMKTL